ncbi:primosomal replication protein N [Andreprevotia sp. IGB-42]|uniref:primosomal replication protein N n=1 Tax=Andreprevotia sp. IGB-42 TaxID=2497473 RepID=UPI00135C9BDD|nr:primosomal replication protein N [Andreprevotia sp. IGB-42]
MDRNRVEITGVLSELPALRHSPAGTPIQMCVIAHQSQRIENGTARKVVAEVEAMAIGKTALALSQLRQDQPVRATGFLACANQKQTRRLVLHIDEFELLN